MTDAARDGTGRRDELQALLGETSRTFALAIPRLPEPRMTEVTVAYLLFRIADTFEDATTWGIPARVAALRELADLLDDPAPGRLADCARRWHDAAPVENAGYLRLLASTPLVFEALGGLEPAAAALIAGHTQRTCLGMAGFLAQADADGVLRLQTLEELRAYCYTVAGIVGEMLTELFLLEGDVVAPIAPRLRERAAAFGEALQLVNILRDAASDVCEGRALVPPAVARAELFALARADLLRASEYTLALQATGARRGIVAFTALPILLAIATLERVERAGPGAKISRAEVARLITLMETNLRLGRPVVRLAGSAAAARRPAASARKPG